ncbi:MAG: preprotein translocase subunit SecG [Bacteroidota bacterium]
MLIFLIVLIAILCVLISVFVLLQSGKGGGLAGIASAGGATQLLGARHAPNVLEKGTWILGGVFIFLCIISNVFIDSTEQRESIIQQNTEQVPIDAPVPAPAPGGDAPAQE